MAGWLRADLLTLFAGLSDAQLDAEPAQGRSPRNIGLHVLESEGNYVRAALGPVTGLSSLVGQVQAGFPLLAGFDCAWRLEDQRIRAMTDAERAGSMQRGEATWTAHKMLRRMLEHEWEHLCEVSFRLTMSQEAP